MDHAGTLSESDEIRVQKLSHAVADRLREQIVSGQRKPGDHLPPESDLLVQFKVSRPTIREALRILEAEGLIALGRGTRAGATVFGPSVDRAAAYAAMVLVSGGTTVSELHEARAMLEPSMIHNLVRKRDQALLDELQSQLHQATGAIAAGKFELALAHTNEFHAALVHGSENRALILIVDMLKLLSSRATYALVENSVEEANAVQANLVKTVNAYQQLVELVRTGKADEAHAFWVRYMDRAGAFLVKSGLGARRLRHY